jgi:hypothetical protein
MFTKAEKSNGILRNFVLNVQAFACQMASAMRNSGEHHSTISKTRRVSLIAVFIVAANAVARAGLVTFTFTQYFDYSSIGVQGQPWAQWTGTFDLPYAVNSIPTNDNNGQRLVFSLEPSSTNRDFESDGITIETPPEIDLDELVVGYQPASFNLGTGTDDPFGDGSQTRIYGSALPISVTLFTSFNELGASDSNADEDVIGGGPDAGAFDNSADTVNIVAGAVPEPATTCVVGMTSLMLLSCRRGGGRTRKSG